jgi:hypothetical protein
MQAAHPPAGKIVQADGLTDDLKWDFLRELVEEEFSKFQAQAPTHAKAFHRAPVVADPAAAMDGMSGASTQYSSPAGKPQDRSSPKMSPMHGALDSTAPMAVPRLLPAQDYAGSAVNAVALPSNATSRFAMYAGEPLVYADTGMWSVSC